MGIWMLIKCWLTQCAHTVLENVYISEKQAGLLESTMTRSNIMLYCTTSHDGQTHTHTPEASAVCAYLYATLWSSMRAPVCKSPHDVRTRTCDIFCTCVCRECVSVRFPRNLNHESPISMHVYMDDCMHTRRWVYCKTGVYWVSELMFTVVFFPP